MIKQLDLPKAISEYGQSSFRDTLTDELYNIKFKLPLEEFLFDGDWVDDETLEIRILDDKYENDEVKVLLEVAFDEMQKTGCEHIQNHEQTQGRWVVVLNLVEKDAYLHNEDEWLKPTNPTQSHF